MSDILDDPRVRRAYIALEDEFIAKYCALLDLAFWDLDEWRRVYWSGEPFFRCYFRKAYERWLLTQ